MSLFHSGLSDGICKKKPSQDGCRGCEDTQSWASRWPRPCSGALGPWPEVNDLGVDNIPSKMGQSYPFWHLAFDKPVHTFIHSFPPPFTYATDIYWVPAKGAVLVSVKPSWQRHYPLTAYILSGDTDNQPTNKKILDPLQWWEASNYF